MYGDGTVDEAGRSIIPSPGVVVYELTGAMVGSPNGAPPTGAPPGAQKGKDGDPVDLSTGLFDSHASDLMLSDMIPIALERTYRTNDNRSRAFGIGTSHQYEMFLVGDTYPYTYQELILADGARIRFDRTSAGTDYVDAAYTHTATDTEYYGATIKWNTASTCWSLTMRTGMIYSFPEAYGLTNPAAQALTGITDRYGNTLTLTRSNANLTRISSSQGRYITLHYDASNRVTSATDNIGRNVSYTYYPGGRLGTVTDSNGGITTYTYNPQNQVSTITDARSMVNVTNQYDSSGRVIRQTLANGAQYRFAWTPSTNASQLYFVNGGANNVSPISTAFRYCSDCSKGYSALISQVDVTDPLGFVRRATFNAAGYMINDIRALGQPEQQTTTYQYYADNLLKAVTDPLGNTTTYDYDVSGNLTRTTRLASTPQALTTSATFAVPFNGIATITDPLNHTTTFAYDTAGNVVTATDPMGHQVTMTYNPAGQMITRTDGLGNSSQLQYFGSDLTSVIDPLSNASYRFSDAIGRLVSSTDAFGQVITFRYDKSDRIVATTDPAGGVIATAYDSNGNLLSVTDARGGLTSYTYDTMGYQTSRTDPLHQIETTQYDLFENVLSTIDRKGQVTSYSHDSLRRLTFAGINKSTNQGVPSYESTISYTYDQDGRLTQATDSASGTSSRSFDALDQLLNETTVQSSISYLYDAGRRRIRRLMTGQVEVAYIYDDASRLIGITQGTSTVGIAYDNANRRTLLTFPNGLTAGYTYDNGSRLTGLSYQSGGNLLGSLNYAYDKLGKRTQVSGTLARGALPAALASATYNGANELTGWNGVRVSYDANGNMTSGDSLAFSWNARDQLVGIGGSSTAAFQYDTAARRAAKTIGATSTSFVYDGDNSIQENAGSVNAFTGRVDEVFQRSASASSVVPITDGIGSAIALTDSTGNIQTQYTYDPFGNTSTYGAASDNTLQYTGRENDGSDIYYYRARYYSPKLQRFLSEDPSGFGGGINLYSYVLNSPITSIDPQGLDSTSWGIGHDWNNWNGRGFSDGPRNGNWGGKHWGGGWNPSQHGGKEGPLPPTDSGDMCYEKHDRCYDADCSNAGEKTCDAQLVQCLLRLPTDSKKWPFPPRAGTTDDSEHYRSSAIWWFSPPNPPLPRNMSNCPTGVCGWQ